MKFEEVIIDADICIKLGRIEKIPILKNIVMNLAQKAYIHKYVYEDEVLTPETAKVQLNELINIGKLQVVDDSEFDNIDSGLTRKDARAIWVAAGNNKNSFNNEVWPIS